MPVLTLKYLCAFLNNTFPPPAQRNANFYYNVKSWETWHILQALECHFHPSPICLCEFTACHSGRSCIFIIFNFPAEYFSSIIEFLSICFDLGLGAITHLPELGTYHKAFFSVYLHFMSPLIKKKVRRLCTKLHSVINVLRHKAHAIAEKGWWAHPGEFKFRDFPAQMSCDAKSVMMSLSCIF